jgi:hypothetical protein
LIDTLEGIKKKDPDLRYAYAYENQEDNTEQSATKPKLDRMIIQTAMMRKYY